MTFAGALTSGLAGFGLSLVLGRGLGPLGSGIIFQMIAVFTIAGAIGKLGLDTTAVWLLPRVHTDHPHDVRRATAVLLLGALVGGLVAGGALLAFAPLFESPQQEELATLVRLSAAFLPLASVLVVALAVTRGLGGIRSYVLIGSIALPTLRLAAVSVAIAFSAGALGAGLAWLAVAVPAALAALFAVTRALRPFRAHQGQTSSWSSLTTRVRAYALPRAVSSAIEQALLWLDVLIVGVLAGPVAAGVYGVVSRLIQAGSIPSTSMRIVVAPQFSRMLHLGRTSELSDLYTRTTQWIILTSVPVFVLLAALAPAVLHIFGPGFAAGALALMIMCVGATVSVSTGNVQSLLLMSGRTGWAAMNKAIVLVVSVVLLLALVPWWGVVGAAIAWTISMTLDAVLAVVQVSRATGIRLEVKAVATALLCAGISTAIPAVASRLIFGDSLLALAVGVGAGLVCWLGALFFTRRQFALEHTLSVVNRRR